jgi:hypothetical protein
MIYTVLHMEQKLDVLVFCAVYMRFCSVWLGIYFFNDASTCKTNKKLLFVDFYAG